MKSQARIFQPNLMVRFHRTGTPDGMIKILTGVNKDDNVGIVDEQIITSLWSWTQTEYKRLKQNNVKPPSKSPTTDTLLSINTNGSVFNLMVFSGSQKVPVDDYTFCGSIMTYCIQINKVANLDLSLKGVEGVFTRREEGISPEM